MKKFLLGILLVFIASLYGCGGGSSGAGPTPSTVSGTVSKGVALSAGTTVTLKDAKGVSKVTSTVGDNGAYSIVVDGLMAPYILNSGGLYSCASAPGTTNVNPLTHLAMQLTLGKSTISDTDSASLPANFLTSFRSVTTDLMSKTDGLYPSSVTAAQKDYLNGNITINNGVDKVFISLIPSLTRQ